MSKATVEKLLELLDVRLEAFAICEIEPGFSLSCAPMDSVVVHYVIDGRGVLECEHGTTELQAGTMIVVPRNLAKRINGEGTIANLIDANDACPWGDGIGKFRAGDTGAPGLVLACGRVSATVGEGIGLFDHLDGPLFESGREGKLPLLFETMFDELVRPAVGTRAIVETLMKQILIVLLRMHLKRCGLASPLYLPLMNPQLGKALLAMLARPQENHTLEELAAISGMSRSRFAHHFGVTYGITPIEFLQSIRLKRAARMLRASGLPVKAVAAAVGYASRSQFSRAFRAAFGVDPSAFRRSEDRSDPRQDGSLEVPAGALMS